MATPELFSPNLIDQKVKDALPKGYILRPLARDDYHKGFFECLQALTRTGKVSEERYLAQYDWMTTKGADWFYNAVIEHDGRIVGTGVVIVERKFIWDLGTVGHLEDISIAKDFQSSGLGKCLINALTSIGKNVGCCKIILNCSEENEGFYAKCGYERGSLEMKHELPGFKGDESD